MRKEELAEAGIRFGTPLYIYDIDILKQQVRQICKKLGRETEICYAMKANPFLTDTMADMVGRIEVCSFGEYQICRKLRMNPEKLLISGVMKKPEELKQILRECGAKAVYTVESPRQLFLLDRWARKHQQNLQIYLRLSNGNQFGMDRQTIDCLIRERENYPLLQIEGLHYFTGTQKRTVEQIKKELKELDKYMYCTEKEKKFVWKHLEYGPGIGVSYFQESEYFSEEVFSEISSGIHDMKWKGTVTLEMGRVLTAMCGYYLTEVQDCKCTGNRRYCIVDGGSHQLNYDGQIRGMYRPYLQVLEQKPGDPEDHEEDWTICGSLCTTSDILAANVRLSGVKVGTRLVFERTGAYSATEGMALFLSHTLPGVVLYSSEAGWIPVRKQWETYPLNMSDNSQCWWADGNLGMKSEENR